MTDSYWEVFTSNIKLSLAGCSPAEPTSVLLDSVKVNNDEMGKLNGENKQVHFCPLDSNLQNLGTFLSITPKNAIKLYLKSLTAVGFLYFEMFSSRFGVYQSSEVRAGLSEFLQNDFRSLTLPYIVFVTIKGSELAATNFKWWFQIIATNCCFARWYCSEVVWKSTVTRQTQPVITGMFVLLYAVISIESFLRSEWAPGFDQNLLIATRDFCEQKQVASPQLFSILPGL